MFIQKGRTICGAFPKHAAHLQYTDRVAHHWTQMKIADPGSYRELNWGGNGKNELTTRSNMLQRTIMMWLHIKSYRSVCASAAMPVSSAVLFVCAVESALTDNFNKIAL